MGDLLTIPNFELEEEIGRGGMARVYLARQLAPKRRVAVKVVSPRRGDDPSFLQTLKQEGDTVAQFSHENIVTVYACGVVDNHYYLAMEILNGGDLAGRIGAGLPADEALSILRQMASALDHAHQRNTLHRDIKPENILFHESGKAVLVDFGIAKDADSESNFTKAGAVVGTPHYMAPERAQGKPVDARSDIYALGVLFYEMLTGEKMYSGGDTFAISYAHVYESIPELPTPLARYQPLLNRMVAKNPDDRFQSASELTRALDEIHASAAPTPSDDTGSTVVIDPATDNTDSRPRASKSPDTPPPARRRSPLVWGSLGVAIVAATLAVVLSLRDSGSDGEPVLSMEVVTLIRDRLAAAEAMVRMGKYQDAENVYALVLSEYDCGNKEARNGLRAANPKRYEETIANCD